MKKPHQMPPLFFSFALFLLLVGTAVLAQQSSTGSPNVGGSPVCNLLCIIGDHCVIVNGTAQCVPNENNSTSTAVTPVSGGNSSGRPPVCNMLCIRGYHCVIVNGTAQCVPITSSSTGSPPPGNSTCPPGESYRQCASACEPTCANPDPICILICDSPKCQCLSGYVRHNGVCIPRNQCPANGSSTVAPLQCGIGEQQSRCACCEQTCQNSHPICPLFCTTQPRCCCNPGYVRVGPRRCVPALLQCPAQTCCSFFPHYRCVQCAPGFHCVGPFYARHCAPLLCTLFCPFGRRCLRIGTYQFCVPIVFPPPPSPVYQPVEEETMEISVEELEEKKK